MVTVATVDGAVFRPTLSDIFNVFHENRNNQRSFKVESSSDCEMFVSAGREAEGERPADRR